MNSPSWLPDLADWRTRLRTLSAGDPADSAALQFPAPMQFLAPLQFLARSNLDCVSTRVFDTALRRLSSTVVAAGGGEGTASGCHAHAVRF